LAVTGGGPDYRQEHVPQCLAADPDPANGGSRFWASALRWRRSCAGPRSTA